jgi:TRAP transporter TAXI family solute receptor
MKLEDLAALSRRDRARLAVVGVILLAAVVWASVKFVQSGPPRHLVLASGAESGIYHQYALRYKEILSREGVKVDIRMTRGADDNLALLLDPKSGVDVAFMQGGIATFPAADGLEMLASLYYEPLWIFYRNPEPLTRLNELHGKRIAIGVAGSGTRAVVRQLFAANGLANAAGVGRDNTDTVALGGDDALRALQAGEIDAALFVGGADTPTIQQALRDPVIKLMSLRRADAYARRFPFLSKLMLPYGTLDLAANIPAEDTAMVGTKAMLVARDTLHPALVDLLVDAAREIHGHQGYFEAAGEFPGTAQVDIPVSAIAEDHEHFGPSYLHRYLPFWLATFVERAVILIVPLIVVLVPLANFLPQFLRWRVRSRIYRWYGELALLEHDVATRQGTLPVEQWLQDLDRIEEAAEHIHTPTSFASEAYTLREHIGLVRRAVLAKADAAARAVQGDGISGPALSALG